MVYRNVFGNAFYVAPVGETIEFGDTCPTGRSTMLPGHVLYPLTIFMLDGPRDQTIFACDSTVKQILQFNFADDKPPSVPISTTLEPVSSVFPATTSPEPTQLTRETQTALPTSTITPQQTTEPTETPTRDDSHTPTEVPMTTPTMVCDRTSHIRHFPLVADFVSFPLMNVALSTRSQRRLL